MAHDPVGGDTSSGGETLPWIWVRMRQPLGSRGNPACRRIPTRSTPAPGSRWARCRNRNRRAPRGAAAPPDTLPPFIRKNIPQEPAEEEIVDDDPLPDQGNP